AEQPERRRVQECDPGRGRARAPDTARSSPAAHQREACGSMACAAGALVIVALTYGPLGQGQDTAGPGEARREVAGPCRGTVTCRTSVPVSSVYNGLPARGPDLRGDKGEGCGDGGCCRTPGGSA